MVLLSARRAVTRAPSSPVAKRTSRTRFCICDAKRRDGVHQGAAVAAPVLLRGVQGSPEAADTRTYVGDPWQGKACPRAAPPHELSAKCNGSSSTMPGSTDPEHRLPRRLSATPNV